MRKPEPRPLQRRLVRDCKHGHRYVVDGDRALKPHEELLSALTEHQCIPPLAPVVAATAAVAAIDVSGFEIKWTPETIKHVVGEWTKDTE